MHGHMGGAANVVQLVPHHLQAPPRLALLLAPCRCPLACHSAASGGVWAASRQTLNPSLARPPTRSCAVDSRLFHANCPSACNCRHHRGDEFVCAACDNHWVRAEGFRVVTSSAALIR